jgi:hypothetical protein
VVAIQPYVGHCRADARASVIALVHRQVCKVLPKRVDAEPIRGSPWGNLKGNGPGTA